MWDLVGKPEDRFSHNEAHMQLRILLILNDDTLQNLSTWN